MATIFAYVGRRQTGVELPSVLIISSVCFSLPCVLQVYPMPECQDCCLCLDLPSSLPRLPLLRCYGLLKLC